MGVIDDRGNRPRASASKAREATIRGLADPFDARKRRAVGSAKILLAAARRPKGLRRVTSALLALRSDVPGNRESSGELMSERLRFSGPSAEILECLNGASNR